MNSSVRVILDIAFRSVALLVLSEGVAELYAAGNPTDDGLGTGLTVMFVLVVAAVSWGLLDGFRHGPLRLCVTWVSTGFVVALASTIYHHLRFGEWSWSALASDLSSGLGFWAGLIFVPAIGFGIVQSASRHSSAGPVAGVRAGH